MAVTVMHQHLTVSTFIKMRSVHQHSTALFVVVFLQKNMSVVLSATRQSTPKVSTFLSSCLLSTLNNGGKTSTYVVNFP